jgi:hypothetical protein
VPWTVPWPTGNTRGFNTLTFLDLAKNWLTGTLPPELMYISAASSLMLSVFDNNIVRYPAACGVASHGADASPRC